LDGESISGHSREGKQEEGGTATLHEVIHQTEELKR
jgi:hypothetical protein